MGNSIQVTPQDLDDAEIVARDVPCEVDENWQRIEEIRTGARPLQVPIRYI